MKIKECIELGIACGLKTVREAVFNVLLHATCLFSYPEINKELSELYASRDALFCKSNYTEESQCKDVLSGIRMEEYGMNQAIHKIEEKISEIKDQLRYTVDEDMAVRLRCKMHGLDEALQILQSELTPSKNKQGGVEKR